MKRRAFLSFLLLAILATTARAQIGQTTDIITGVVSASDGTPLGGATVEALSMETQIARTVRTDSRGRYTLVFPDGGGQYRITIRYIGMQPSLATVQRVGDDDRLVWDAKLTASAVQLDPILVRGAPQPVRMPDLPAPGSIERSFTPDLIARLPADVTDLALLALLAPGVVGIPETDSTGAAFSVAGQRPDANAVTLDGMRSGGGDVPQDAVRQTRVITSTYDVGRGQFSGGMVASTTRGGTNMLQGSSSYSLRDEALTLEESDDPQSPFAQGFTQHQLSGGLGGPLVKNRLFLFGSLQGRLRDDAQQTLLSATETDLSRLGVHPDSLTRFLSAVQGVGISPTSVQPQPIRNSDNYSALGRLDYVINDAHTLMLRGDWRGTSQDPTRVPPLSLPETGGLVTSSGNGGMASLTSRFGVHVINEIRGSVSRSARQSDPFLALPSGRVQVASMLPDGSRGVTALTFGGNAGMPARSRGTSYQATDEISWLPGTGRHRVRLGVLLDVQRSNDLVANNLYGTFTYNSIADLEQGRPASFRRTVVPIERRSYQQNAALYIGDVWRIGRAFQLTYGARLEQSSFPEPPPYNAAIETSFGRRTDVLPMEWHGSSRVGFTWTLGLPEPVRPGAGAPAGTAAMAMAGFRRPALTLRGGIGEYRSPVPSGLVAQAQSSTGFATSETQISCIGLGVPIPNWSAYDSDVSSIPGACIAGGPSTAAPSPNAVVFAPGFQAPRAWRASLGFERSLTMLLRLTVDASFARGVSQYGYRDLNLAPQPAFTLPDEADRPVFVNPASIATSTGAVSLVASRLVPAFGQVMEISSGLASEQKQLTTSIGGVTRRGVQVQFSYTLARSRDQSGVRFPVTAGDPNAREWAASDFDRRHSFQTTLTYPFGRSIELTSVGRLSSGAPFTPVVGSDINGDGARNDRAFVFDPAGVTPAAPGMSRLLTGADDRVRSCLTGQVGSAAARNSCMGPWQATFDLQLNLRPRFFGLNGRLMISVVTVNFLRGVDDLVHGSANAHGWGLTLRPDPNLLYTTGFDTTARRFVYTVNERFGATGSGANAIRSPFQVGINARFTLGQDRARQALDALRGGPGGAGGPGGRGPGIGGGGGRGTGPGAGQFLARMGTLLPNPAAQVLEIRDSLALSPDQVAKIEAIRDTLNDRNTPVANSIQKAVQAQSGAPDPARFLQSTRPLIERGRANVALAHEALRAILTPAQWAKLPESIRNPRAPIRPGFGGPPGAERRPGGTP